MNTKYEGRIHNSMIPETYKHSQIRVRMIYGHMETQPRSEDRCFDMNEHFLLHMWHPAYINLSSQFLPGNTDNDHSLSGFIIFCHQLAISVIGLNVKIQRSLYKP